MLYTRLLRPVLFSFDPEKVHHRTLQLGQALSRSAFASRLIRRWYQVKTEGLGVRVWGLDFKNPLGLPGGFDKQGWLHPVIAALGFGHMEVGSVSLRPWAGNASPTLLRLPRDWALINRLGLNSDGAEAVYGRLAGTTFQTMTGINLVKTADPSIAGDQAVEDYVEDFKTFYDVAHFITLNLSCPNTCEGKTFEDPEMLEPFLGKIQEFRLRSDSRKPVLIKLSPDLDDAGLDRVLALVEGHEMDGIVVGNATARHDCLVHPTAMEKVFQGSGLSGLPLKKYIAPMVEKVFSRTQGRIPVVACGGIGCDPTKHPAEEVWDYLRLGATLVQTYTGLIYQGPSLPRKILRELPRILKRNGFSSMNEFLEARGSSRKAVSRVAG